ncbi:hypothetical protein [Fictibacillus norfolkensis]|uniref:Uncharacterized protein n=1 Tax=Fictibacillus norfolkensis TaxID=2762233 RepID=A0ABR8SPH5_9BACL|nr:hypothetical protein [Fictibacillus norfolkensis]MBD7965387.1 hypothetical protein [Fictibacillus norfolkensis]
MSYNEPGLGAIEFAKHFIKNMNRNDALKVTTQLLKGELHDNQDNRVKRCDYCGYWWKDNSLRNTRKTCSDGCKTSIKTLQKREQRANEFLLNPEKKEKKETLMDYYLWWLDHPFWVQEYAMIKVGWKFERPSGVSLMNYIEAKNELYGMGNRKTSKKVVNYHGNSKDEF